MILCAIFLCEFPLLPLIAGNTLTTHLGVFLLFFHASIRVVVFFAAIAGTRAWFFDAGVRGSALSRSTASSRLLGRSVLAATTVTICKQKKLILELNRMTHKKGETYLWRMKKLFQFYRKFILDKLQTLSLHRTFLNIQFKFRCKLAEEIKFKGSQFLLGCFFSS